MMAKLITKVLLRTKAVKREFGMSPTRFYYVSFWLGPCRRPQTGDSRWTVVLTTLIKNYASVNKVEI